MRKLLFLYCFILCFVTMFIVLFNSHSIISMFMLSDTEVYNVALNGARIVSVSYIFIWMSIVTNSYLTALNFPVLSFILSILDTFVYPIILLFLLTSLFELNGVWLMSVFSSIFSFLTSLCFLKYVSLKLKCNINVKEKLEIKL